MPNFDINSLPNLDKVVVNALELFTKQKLPKLDLGNYKRPLVVGSGNAAVTGKILLEDYDAVFADESTYLKKMEAITNIDGCILISASGGKHAPIIAKDMRKRKIETRLLTNNPNAAAKEFIDKDKFFVFTKQIEPYTYNTSTYMSMILAKTKENPKEILDFIRKKITPIVPENFANYDAFFIIVPDKFDNIREMFLTKFDELFGPVISGRIFTPEQAKHAKTVIPYNREFFISFGYKNTIFGDNNARLNVPLPKNADYASLMAIGYYVIGKIQGQHPPYFKRSIAGYCKDASRVFGQEIKPIVE